MCGFFRDNTIFYCLYTLTDGIFAIFGLPVNNLVIQLGEKYLVNFWPAAREGIIVLGVKGGGCRGMLH